MNTSNTLHNNSVLIAFSSSQNSSEVMISFEKSLPTITKNIEALGCAPSAD